MHAPSTHPSGQTEQLAPLRPQALESLLVMHWPSRQQPLAQDWAEQLFWEVFGQAVSAKARQRTAKKGNCFTVRLQAPDGPYAPCEVARGDEHSPHEPNARAAALRPSRSPRSGGQLRHRQVFGLAGEATVKADSFYWPSLPRLLE